MLDIMNSDILLEICTENKRQFEQIFPELIKRLIINSVSFHSAIRFPSNNDVWAPGFDGRVISKECSNYVVDGESVWELGTNSDSLRKINSDYEKRTKNTLGVDPKNTAFYLVVPRIWAFNSLGCSIEEWEKSHSDWKSVRVYDASILCDWINSVPSVCVWLLELFGRGEGLGFRSVKAEWNRFAKMTTPALVSEMFCLNRDDNANDFWNRVEGNEPKIIVKAQSIIDAKGFVLSQLLTRNEYKNSVVVVDNSATLKRIAGIVRNKILLLAYSHSGIIDRGDNRIIICVNTEATSITNAISLPSLTKTGYETALRRMGLNDGEIYEAFAFTHCNLRALIRRIPGDTIESKPDWAGNDSKKYLVPLVFLRNIDRNKDVRLVELLSDYKYNEIEQNYHSLTMMEDSPIKVVDNHYVIVNYEEAWSALGLSFDDSNFEKLSTTLSAILEEISSKGNYEERSSYNIEGIIHNLLLNYIYYSYERNRCNKLSSVVLSLLNYVYDKNASLYIIRDLSVLAEACPTVTMDFLVNDFERDDSVIRTLFDESEKDSLYTNILHALDKLVLYQATFVESCSLLLKLFLFGKDYHLVNTPENSLLNALCLLRFDGEITIHQKVAFISKNIQTNDVNIIVMFTKLLNRDSYTTSVRLGERRTYTERISRSDYNNAKNTLLKQFLKKAVELKSIFVWLQLLNEYSRFPINDLTKAADEFNIDEYDSDDVNSLHYWLREERVSCRSYRSEDYNKYASFFDKWIEKTTYKDDVMAARWMFHNAYNCPVDRDNDDSISYLQPDDKVFELRKNTLVSLVEENGIEAGMTIVGYMDDKQYWGRVIVESIDSSKLSSICDNLKMYAKIQILGSVLSICDFGYAKTYLFSLNEEEKRELIPLLSNSAFLPYLSEDEMKLYWSQKHMHEYSQDDYDGLIKYNPSGLLPYIYLCSMRNSDPNIEMIMEVFNALVSFSDNTIERRYQDYIMTIIARIDSVYYSDEWAKICLRVCEYINEREYPESVLRYWFIRPDRIYSYFERESYEHFKFIQSFKLPLIAYDDYHGFYFFFSTIKKYLDDNGKDYGFIGDVLGKTIVGADGMFPHEFTRELLEEFNSRVIDDCVANSYEDLYEVRYVQDGTYQLEKSKECLHNAQVLQLDYPHSAYVLKRISELYESIAKRDYVSSEIEY